MNINSFLNDGALISMANKQTRFFKETNLTPDKSNAWFVNPGFSLKDINKQISFKYSTLKISEFMRSPEILDINLSWVADILAYQNKYKKIMELFRSGELKKAVPFITFKSLKPKNFNQLILPQIINRLIENKHEDEYLYGIWRKGEGFIGATPEILIQGHLDSNKYSTMALAGTLPVDDPTDMLLDSKLFEEHKMVMQDISKKLSGHDITWNKSKEKKYGILKHIYTDAQFCSDLDFKSLIKKLSPTSALGVYPSENWQSYEDILDLEGRGSYGAPFGLVSEDELMILVCLRGLFWDEENLYIRVGGGLTIKSEYEKEFKELELKFLSTKTKLGI